MNIRYNIASDRKIDHKKFILIAAVLAVLSALLIIGGALQLAASSKEFRDEKEKLRAYKEKIEAINERETQQEAEIKKIKQKWRKKRNFINGIIEDKTFPYMDKLAKLEEILPSGVFVHQFGIGTNNKTSLQLSISALSSQKLLEAYKVFLKYNMVVNNETESEGLFLATITIQLRNENK